jgi:phage shock protein E
VTPDKDAQIYLYCRSGRRSGIALEALQEAGYRNAVNIGGLQEAGRKAQEMSSR